MAVCVLVEEKGHEDCSSAPCVKCCDFCAAEGSYFGLSVLVVYCYLSAQLDVTFDFFSSTCVCF